MTVNILNVCARRVNLWRNVIFVAMSVRPFLHDPLTTSSSEETFLRDFIENIPLYYMLSDLCNRLKYLNAHYCAIRRKVY